MIINIKKRYAFIIFGLLVSAVGLFLVYALASGVDTNQGYHESNQVSVSVAGIEKTLQEAIDDGSFGGGEESISSGFCIFSDVQASCPTGWTRRTQFDSRTIRGDLTPGGTGGSESHTHTGPSHTHSVVIPYSGWSVGGWSVGYNSVIRREDEGSAQSANRILTSAAGGTGVTSSASSWAPYVNVIVCCKD